MPAHAAATAGAPRAQAWSEMMDRLQFLRILAPAGYCHELPPWKQMPRLPLPSPGPPGSVYVFAFVCVRACVCVCVCGYVRTYIVLYMYINVSH